jgi:hypothetical protein
VGTLLRWYQEGIDPIFGDQRSFAAVPRYATYSFFFLNPCVRPLFVERRQTRRRWAPRRILHRPPQPGTRNAIDQSIDVRQRTARRR